MAGCARFPFHALIEFAQRGDPNAFSELVEGIRDRVERLVLRLVGNPRLDAEDILQESLVQAFRSIGALRVRTEDGFMAWFAGIVRNRVGAVTRGNRERQRPRRTTALPWAMQHGLDPMLLDGLVTGSGTEMAVREVASFGEEPRAGLVSESRVAFVLRDGFRSEWRTLGLILGRRSVGGLRKTVRSARGEALGGIVG